MARRWICPRCETGCLAPDRPRRDDVRRYCLKCSEKTGRLVERSCPALEKTRAVQTERTRAKAAARRSKAASEAKAARERAARKRKTREERAARDAQAAREFRGYDMIAEAERVWSLMDEFHRGKRLPEIVLRRSTNGRTTGRAWPWRIVVTMGDDVPAAVMVLIHELAHSAVGDGHGHDEVWADCYVKAARARWGVEHFEGVRAAKGYAVDRYVAPAVRRAMLASGLVSYPANGLEV